VTTNGFLWAKVSEAFIRSPELPPILVPINGTMFPMPYTFNDTHGANGKSPDALTYESVLRLYADVQANLSMFENLTNWECYQNYSNVFNWRPQVILVSGDREAAVTLNTSLFDWENRLPSHFARGWMYSGLLDPSLWVPGLDLQSPSEAEIGTWANEGSLVQYCLRKLDSEGQDAFNTCHLEASPLVLTGTYSMPCYTGLKFVSNFCSCYLLEFP
jgi:hypothetical protein